MGKAILDSLSEDFRARVIQFAQEYEISQNGETYNDGPCVLKRIFDLVFIQTDDEGFTIRDEILGLELTDYNQNVVEYNVAMKDLIRHLEATSEGMSDQAIKHSLIKAYRTARNDEFTRFIEHLMNSGPLPSILTLMTRAEQKYKQLVNGGTWDEIPKDEQILALKIETKKLKQELKKRPKKREEKTSTKKENRTKYKKRDEERSAWMYQAPKENEKKIVKRQGKEWAWCKYHKKWVVRHTERFGEHTSETCLLNPKNKDKKGKKAKGSVEIEANVAADEEDLAVATDSDESMEISSGGEEIDDEI